MLRKMQALRHILSYSRQIHLRKYHHCKNSDNVGYGPEINAHNNGATNVDFIYSFAQASHHARWKKYIYVEIIGDEVP
jgi:hypothetical protein